MRTVDQISVNEKEVTFFESQIHSRVFLRYHAGVTGPVFCFLGVAEGLGEGQYILRVRARERVNRAILSVRVGKHHLHVDRAALLDVEIAVVLMGVPGLFGVSGSGFFE